MLEVLCLVLFIILLLYRRWKRRDLLKIYQQIGSGIKTLPLIGHSYLFIGGDENRMRVLQTFARDAIARGGMSCVWHGDRFYIMVTDPAVANVLLKTCLEKDDIMKLAQLLTDNGSIFAAVAIWRPRRKVLAPNFSVKNLTSFGAVFTRQSEVLVAQLKRVAGCKAFSAWNFFSTYTMDAVCESSLGVQIKSQLNPDQPFLKAFEECCDLGAARMCQPWLHNLTVYKMLPAYTIYMRNKHFMVNFVKRIIQSKRNAKLQENKQTISHCEESAGLVSLLELLMGSSGFSDVELQEEAMVMVMAGTDTTAVAASFTALMLAAHQREQELVYQELREVIGDSNRPVEADDLPRLKYLDAFVKETLRLYPPVPIITRKVEKDVEVSNGITLIPGCGIVVNIWGIHRNPRYWGDDAEEFRPERFLHSELKHPAAFMPFSYGPRACLGYQFAMMTLKTALASVLQQYRLVPAEDTQTDKHAPLRVKFDIMMKDVNNFRLRIESRF